MPFFSRECKNNFSLGFILRDLSPTHTYAKNLKELIKPRILIRIVFFLKEFKFKLKTFLFDDGHSTFLWLELLLQLESAADVNN